MNALADGSACTWLGPCGAMHERIREGWARLERSKLLVGSGWWMSSCPWCGGEMTATMLAMWPWQRYAEERAQQPMKQVDGEP